jgi:hypothetical protein
MKFDEIKNESTTRKDYPKVIVKGKIEKILKKGTTSKGSYLVLSFNDASLSAIYFGQKEEIDEKFKNLDVGSEVEMKLSGSERGNVLKDISSVDRGEEGENPSSSHLSDNDMKAFVPDSVFIHSFKCGNCGEENLMFKEELRNEIERRVNMGVLPKRSCHVQEN